MIPSFVSRSADKVLYKLKESSSANDELLEIRNISEKFINSNENREHVIEETFNSCIRDSWEIKKNMKGRWRRQIKNGIKLNYEINISHKKKDINKLFNLSRLFLKKRPYICNLGNNFLFLQRHYYQELY